MKILSNILTVAVMAGGVTLAHNSQVEAAWAHWEECNGGLDLADLTDLQCDVEEVREIYYNGSYDEECIEEGCSSEER